MNKLICDFNDGERCTQEADNVGIDATTRECLAIVCEHHAECLANDGHMQNVRWFVEPNPTVMTKIELLHALDVVSMHHRVELRPNECEQFFEKFDDEALALVKAINALVPPMRYGDGNPNTGKPHHTFNVGREFTRVIYVELVAAYFKNDEERRAVADGIVRLAAEAGADESDVKEKPGSTTVRLWWD